MEFNENNDYPLSARTMTQDEAEAYGVADIVVAMEGSLANVKDKIKEVFFKYCPNRGLAKHAVTAARFDYYKDSKDSELSYT